MAEFSLSTARPSRNPSPGGLTPARVDPRALSGIQAGRIDVNAGNVSIGAVPSPQILKNQLVPAALNFGATLAEAAFKYEDRESTYYADQAVLGYKSRIRQAYEGSTDADGKFTPGYSNTVKEEAVEGYSNFVGLTDKLLKDLTSNMEPRVKQKFLVAAYGARNTFLNKAAVHRSAQFEKVLEDQVTLKRQDIARDISTNPEFIYMPDSNGLTAKHKWSKTCGRTSRKECSEAWHDLIQQVGETVYLEEASKTEDASGNPRTVDQALEAASFKATDWYNQVAQVELADSPKHKSAVQGNILRWKADAVRAANSTEKLRQDTVLFEEKQLHKQTMKGLQSRALYGNIESKTELSRMRFTNEISETQFNTYVKTWLSAVPDSVDTPTILEAAQYIRDLDSDSKQALIDAGGFWLDGKWSARLGKSGSSIVEGMYKAATSGVDTQESLDMFKTADLFTQPEKYALSRSIELSKEKRIYLEAELTRKIRERRPTKEILTWLYRDNNPGITKYNSEDRLSNISGVSILRPFNDSQFDTVTNEIYRLHQSGDINTDEKDIKLAELDKFIIALDAHEHWLERLEELLK